MNMNALLNPASVIDINDSCYLSKRGKCIHGLRLITILLTLPWYEYVWKNIQ